MTVALIPGDPLSALGVAAMLDLERIPYVWRRGLADLSDGDLALVAGGEISAHDAAELERRRSLVLGGGGAFAAGCLGATSSVFQFASVRIPLDQPIWPSEVARIATEHGQGALSIPLAPVCAASPTRSLQRLGHHEVGDTDAVRLSFARIGPCLWSAVDLGSAFAHLLHESYEAPSVAIPLPRPLEPWVEGARGRLADVLRWPVRRATHAMLERRIELLGPRRTTYPIESGGALLLELLRALLLRTGETIARVSRWPAPFRAAAALTHDVGVSRFSYGGGLDGLLDRAEYRNRPATVGLVAEQAAARLTAEQLRRLRNHDVLCHGHAQRGEEPTGREGLLADLVAARDALETKLGRDVLGYRSPHLDRSPDLCWALDRSGFAYDSSYPDVDRENAVHFGAGVGLNLPFRPLVRGENGKLRPSRCLELPVTAPNGIRPLLAGTSISMLRRAVSEKAAFVRATGGCYVAAVRSGVRGRRDLERRMNHADFVASVLSDGDVWLTTLAGVHRWWRARETVRVVPRQGGFAVHNDGVEAIAGLRLVVECGDQRTEIELPTIEPQDCTHVPGAAPTAGSAAPVGEADAGAPTPPVEPDRALR